MLNHHFPSTISHGYPIQKCCPTVKPNRAAPRVTWTLRVDMSARMEAVSSSYSSVTWDIDGKNGDFIQCEAPKIAKLVYNYNNYGLWYL